MYTQEITCWHRTFCQVTAANHRGHVVSLWIFYERFVRSALIYFPFPLITSLPQFYIVWS